ncbi:MAG: TIGR03560 family F420-dependent LLM class oxidoreductase [SAR324 cluster bacterium]|nr:TIGR03560 family F420-dependent LLM class oxidoreductase [SAR324 cluster bacterium]
MAVKFGLQSALQDTPMADMQRLWRRADEAGFYWISVWDHLYAAGSEGPKTGCFEGVSAMTALATATSKARVGCLLFCNPFRNPGLLARAAVTIDHISNGRVELGMGAGWKQDEFDDYGYSFGTLGERLDRLEEALQIVRSLLREDSTTFKGKYYQLEGARCFPKPVQEKLRIWVGGVGQRRTPRMAAQYADGFNIPFLSPAETRDRYQRLNQHCEKAGRNPAEIERSVNLEFHMGTDQASADRIRKALEAAGHPRMEGSLTGTSREVVERLGEYVEAGVEGINIAMRPPVNFEAIEAFIEEVMPQFAAA